MEKISLALLTFVFNATWQVAFIAGVASLAARVLRSASARYRHALWVVALFLAIAIPLVNSLATSHLSWTHSPTATAADASVTPLPPAVQAKFVEETAPAASPARARSVPVQPVHFPGEVAIPARLAAILIVVYTGFVLFRIAGLVRACWLTRALLRRSSEVEFPAAVEKVIARCLDFTQAGKVRFLSSASIAAPLTVGTAPAVVVLPERLLLEGDEALLTSAVGHELVHVQCRDYVLNFLYRLLYIPLSFHPAAALIQRRIGETRELRCDEIVTERLLSPAAYARSLVALAGAAHAFRRPATVAVGIADADILEERIMSMLKKPSISSPRRALLLITAAVVFAIPSIASAQYAMRFNITTPAAAVAKSEPASPAAPVQNTKPVPAANPDYEAGVRAGQSYAKRSFEDAMPEERAKMKAELVASQESGFAYTPQSAPEGVARRKMEMKRRRAEEDEDISPAEREARMKIEREEMAGRTKRLAELSKAAKITMQQAIEAALRQQQGTVMESSLMGERRSLTRQPDGSVTEITTGGPTATYRVVILSGDDSAPVRTIVLVNAADGTILNTEVE